MRKGILLVNLGTPDSPKVNDVKRYLSEFLMDERVINIHPFWRFLLVKGIIVPFRGPKSAKLYQEVWDPETGSPLLHYSRLQQQLLQAELGENYLVEMAMRYQHPSIGSALHRLKTAGVHNIQVLPLFPQYASATSGSVIAEVMRIVGNWHTIPRITIIEPFYHNPLFIRAIAARAAKYDLRYYDHVLFSFHGLPLSHLKDCHAPDKDGHHSASCSHRLTPLNKDCYAAQCHETARLIAGEMKLSAGTYTVCFQSRLGRQEWISPYTSTVVRQLAKAGKKRLLVICPAFVADCLETLQEIAIEYRDKFIAAGGEQLRLVESVNESPLFIKALREMAEATTPVNAV
jgi:ferrochelatase